MSLREWLDKPKRPVNSADCLHIFRQAAEALNLSHSQGVVVINVRPSCFVLSSAFNLTASFSESQPCFDSSYGGEAKEGEEEGGGKERKLSLNKILSMELTWYTSPEEAEGRLSTFASDVYKLGVLLFELFCMFETMEEKIDNMSNLRERVLPAQMLLNWPKESSVCLWLLHPQPSSRPALSELLQCDFLNEGMDSLKGYEASIKLKEETEGLELLLDFLLTLQLRMVESTVKLRDTICSLSADIKEAEAKRSIHVKNRCAILYEESPSSSGSRKRLRLINESKHSGSRPEANQESLEEMLSKSSRISKNFKNFEEAYYSSRFRIPLISRVSSGKTEGSSVDYFAFKEGHLGSRADESANPFLDGLCKFLSFSKLRALAEVKQGDMLNSGSLICSLAFDHDKEFLATAGVNRKIKVFECDAILNEALNVHYPVFEMASKSKISSVCWNGYIKSLIASSDFEGAVQVWDITQSVALLEMREHEKRVWSVNCSAVDPMKLASGSDDGTVKLWNINKSGSTGTIITKANVCSVQFPPDSSSTLAVGSADHNVYYYDLRIVRKPLLTLVGHARTVSYVKFMDSSMLVSSSTDNSLKLWDLTASSSGVNENSIRTFTGHTNVKNFVGLSIADGYIATGSETNEVFVYHKAFPMPVLSYRFGSIDHIYDREVDESNQFISCLCWRGESHSLVAANSSGIIKVFEMV